MTETHPPSADPDRAPRLGLRRDGLAPAPEVTSARERGATCPVTSLSGLPCTLLTGYHDVRRMLADPSFGFTTLPPPPGIAEDQGRGLRRGHLLRLDPPDHTRLRALLTPSFTRRAIAALRPRVTALVERALEEMIAGGPPADLVAGFALPVPSLVICELLGVPYADREEFQRRAEGQITSHTARERVGHEQASRAYIETLVARHREDPGPDLIGMLIREDRRRPADRGGIDTDEIAGMAQLLLIAGHDTTSNVIALGTLAVLSDPEQTELLRAAVAAARDGDERPLDRAVEELLRHVSPVSGSFPRRTGREATVGAHRLPAGSMAIASLCAANRDPALGAELDRLDLGRAPVRHVAFGHGAHFCLGAPLARLELKVAFTALLDRLPTLALAVDPAQADFRHEAFIHGLTRLPVRW